MHTAVQTEEYVDPLAPVNVNVAPPPAPSIGIADHLEPPVPLIQHIDMIPEQFVVPASAPYAATSSPVTVTDDVASAPAVTFAAPAPVIEYVAPATPVTVNAYVAPAPVIDYIAPSPAVSYPSFLPSFSLPNEVITSLVSPHISITADEISQEQVVGQEIPEVQVMERTQEQIVVPIEAPPQEHVQLHSALHIVHVPVPQVQSSTSISSAPPSAALAPVTEYNALTPARADFDEWIAHMTFEGDTPAERMMLRRDAQEASAEQAAQELLADEVASKPMGSPATKKAKKGKHKR